LEENVQTLAHRSFYFVRHGETDWNLAHRAQGQTDIPLNDNGRLQAHTIDAKIRHAGIKLICTSPLQRAKETAEIVATALSVPVLIIDELKEACWGEYEGAVKGDWYTKWLGGQSDKGVEPYQAFIRRATNGINRALSNQGPILIVAHGGIYWAIEHGTNVRNDGDAANGGVLFHEHPSAAVAHWRVTHL
jgi:probable phosphoglycerate mutase